MRQLALALATFSLVACKCGPGNNNNDGGSDGGDVSCKRGAPLVPIDITFNWSHDYATSGTHVVTFKVAVCELGVVTKTTTVTS